MPRLRSRHCFNRSPTTAARSFSAYRDPLGGKYTKAFVVARINPLLFKKGGDFAFEDVFPAMVDKAQNFDVGKVKADQLASASGPPE